MIGESVPNPPNRRMAHDCTTHHTVASGHPIGESMVPPTDHGAKTLHSTDRSRRNLPKRPYMALFASVQRKMVMLLAGNSHISGEFSGGAKSGSYRVPLFEQ